jgi:putative ABC transport system ATP-binding protein
MTTPTDVEPGARSGVPVELRAVSKRYQLGDGSTVKAANDIDLLLEAGQFIVVTGSSGSGKSTLLHLVGAIDRPDAGRILVAGRDITELGRRAAADYRASVGFVFQQFHLLPALTVVDNVVAPLMSRRVSFDRYGRAHELLEAVGLANRGGSVPSQLSGGQQQRVAIARALISHPGLLLADEPTGNLDSRTAADVLALLRELQQVHGTTVILASHDQAIASQADRVVSLRDGEILAS